MIILLSNTVTCYNPGLNWQFWCSNITTSRGKLVLLLALKQILLQQYPARLAIKDLKHYHGLSHTKSSWDKIEFVSSLCKSKCGGMGCTTPWSHLKNQKGQIVYTPYQYVKKKDVMTCPWPWYQGPVLLQRSDAVARIPANGSAAFNESCTPIG